jgi:hypothetical protein
MLIQNLELASRKLTNDNPKVIPTYKPDRYHRNIEMQPSVCPPPEIGKAHSSHLLSKVCVLNHYKSLNLALCTETLDHAFLKSDPVMKGWNNVYEARDAVNFPDNNRLVDVHLSLQPFVINLWNDMSLAN